MFVFEVYRDKDQCIRCLLKLLVTPAVVYLGSNNPPQKPNILPNRVSYLCNHDKNNCNSNLFMSAKHYLSYLTHVIGGKRQLQKIFLCPRPP